jgi:hypothetical protein
MISTAMGSTSSVHRGGHRVHSLRWRRLLLYRGMRPGATRRSRLLRNARQHGPTSHSFDSRNRRRCRTRRPTVQLVHELVPVAHVARGAVVRSSQSRYLSVLFLVFRSKPYSQIPSTAVAVNSAAGWLIPEASTICCLLFARKNLRIDRPASSRSEISGGGGRARAWQPAAPQHAGTAAAANSSATAHIERGFVSCCPRVRSRTCVYGGCCEHAGASSFCLLLVVESGVIESSAAAAASSQQHHASHTCSQGVLDARSC